MGGAHLPFQFGSLRSRTVVHPDDSGTNRSPTGIERDYGFSMARDSERPDLTRIATPFRQRFSDDSYHGRPIHLRVRLDNIAVRHDQIFVAGRGHQRASAVEKCCFDRRDSEIQSQPKFTISSHHKRLPLFKTNTEYGAIIIFCRNITA